MKKITLIIIGSGALLVGFIIGYLVAANSESKMTAKPGMHMMADGSMMSNDAHDMDMLGMMASMNEKLYGKTGDDFDKTFISEMIIHHEGAVEMAQLALKNAKHQEIKDLANAIISAQNKEIADMKAWQKNWYNQ